MLGIHVKNVESFISHVDQWFDKVETETAHVANGLTVELFKEILQTSPQLSGDFAGNWQYSINGINRTFNALNFLDQGKPLFKVGDHQAITYARAMNKGRDVGYKLGDTFFLSNSAVHDEPYALKIENGTINFRSYVGNTGETVANAFRNVLPKYVSISKLQAHKLARTKL